MSSESPNSSPLASPSSSDGRKPAPPPRRAFSAKLVPMKVTTAPPALNGDDSGSPINSPAPPAVRTRLGSGVATNSPPASPSISPSPSASIVFAEPTPERTFTPPPTDSPTGSQPSSPASRRLQNRHSMMSLMKDVRKVNTSPVPPPPHQRAAELKIPKPPPSNIPKSVTDDDSVDKIASLVLSFRAGDEEVEAARRIFSKLDINGDGLISWNDFLRFRFDPVNRALHERVASFFATPPQTSIAQVRSTPVVPTSPQSRQTIDEIPIHRPKSKPYDAPIVSPIPIPEAARSEALGVSATVSSSSASSSASTPTVSPSTSTSSIDCPPPVSPVAPKPSSAPLSPRSASLSSGSVSPRNFPKPPLSPRRTTLSADSNGQIPLPTLPVQTQTQTQTQPQPQPQPQQKQQEQTESQQQPQPAPASPPAESAQPAEPTATPKESYAIDGPPAPSYSMARIAHTLAGMDLPDTPREEEEPEPAPVAQDSVQKGLSFRDVDWEKVNAQPDDDSGEENKLDDWDKPRDETKEDARASTASASTPTSSHPPSPIDSPSSSKSEKRKSGKALFAGARSKSSKMLSGLVNKLNGKPSKDSK